MEKRAERYGLRVVPNLDGAIGQKLYNVKLPPLPKTEFWNSPAVQALLNMQDQLDSRRTRSSRPTARGSGRS